MFQRSNDRYWRQLVLVDLEMLNKLGQKHVQNHCVNVQGATLHLTVSGEAEGVAQALNVNWWRRHEQCCGSTVEIDKSEEMRRVMCLDSWTSQSETILGPATCSRHCGDIDSNPHI